MLQLDLRPGDGLGPFKIGILFFLEIKGGTKAT